MALPIGDIGLGDPGHPGGFYADRAPGNTLKELRKSYDAGTWEEVSCGNAANALVVVTKPATGYFAHCVGPAGRGMAPMSPKTFANPIYAETNAFWALKLAETPEAIANIAKEITENVLQQAHAELNQLSDAGAYAERLKLLLAQAAQEFELGQEYEVTARRTDGRAEIYAWSRTTRAFTRAQVRARQVINALQE